MFEGEIKDGVDTLVEKVPVVPDNGPYKVVVPPIEAFPRTVKLVSDWIDSKFVSPDESIPDKV
jgi:hypothetical protein